MVEPGSPFLNKVPGLCATDEEVKEMIKRDYESELTMFHRQKMVSIIFSLIFLLLVIVVTHMPGQLEPLAKFSGYLVVISAFATILMWALTIVLRLEISAKKTNLKNAGIKV